MADKFSLLPGVAITAAIRAKVGKIANKFYSVTNMLIVITSGTRTAQSQAAAMYVKLASGDNLSVYSIQKAIKDIKKAYNDGVKTGKTKVDIIIDIKAVIDKQIASKVYISKHLRSGAVDVRSRTMSKKEKAAFKKASNGIAKKVILELKPPHFHLQF